MYKLSNIVHSKRRTTGKDDKDETGNTIRSHLGRDCEI